MDGFITNYRQLLWAECANTAVYLDNMLVRQGNGTSNFEKFHGKPPEKIINLHPFGHMVVFKLHDRVLRSKLENKGKLGIFVGYTDSHAQETYRIFSI